jgi:hypothetical protein
LNNEVARYITENRDRYTREAIDKQLLSSEYSAVQIAAAWRTVEAASSPPGTTTPSGWEDSSSVVGTQEPTIPRPGLGRRFWLYLVGFIVISYGLPVLLVYISSLVAGSGAVFGNLACVTFAILQLGGLIGGILLLQRDKAVGRALLFGLLFVDLIIPVLAGVALFGYCVYSLSSV